MLVVSAPAIALRLTTLMPHTRPSEPTTFDVSSLVPSQFPARRLSNFDCGRIEVVRNNPG